MKPGYHDRHMEEIPVYNRNQILRTLLQGPKIVNDIIKDTGVYRRSVLLTYLPDLKRAGFITRYKNRKIYEQKKFSKLTDLGYELADLMDGMDKFYKLHLDLRNKIKQTFTPADPLKHKETRSPLRNKGLEEHEINSYNKDSEVARLFEKESLFLSINALKMRYAFIISKFSPNDSAQEHLLKTIANMICRCILIDLESLGNEAIHSLTCKNCGHDRHMPQETLDKQKVGLMLAESSAEIFQFIDRYAKIFIGNKII